MSESSLRVEYHPFGKPPRRPSAGPSTGRLRRMLAWVALLAVLAVLPVAILVRLGVFVYARSSVGPWAAVGAGALATTGLLLFYLWMWRIRVQRRWTLPRAVWVAVAATVGTYVIYALIYLSSANAKSAEIRSTYTALHPLLRIATSTVFLVDRDAVVTDIGRTPADYVAWGLSVNEASLHFEQPDGFVHALDLRTRERAEWRNRLLQLYFRSMGMHTLRHVGTADHLHVSLRPR